MSQPEDDTPGTDPDPSPSNTTAYNIGGAVFDHLPDATVELPPKVEIADDLVTGVPDPAIASRIELTIEGVDKMLGDLRAGLLEKGQGHRLPAGVGQLLGFVALRSEMPERVEDLDLPQNADKVPPAASQTLETVRSVPAAAILDLPPARLEKPLIRFGFLQLLLDHTAWFPHLVERHRVLVLRDLDRLLRSSVEGSRSVINRSARLQSGLSRAMALVSEPGQKAAETRKDHASVAAKAVAADRARHLVTPVTDSPKPADPAKPTDPAKKG